jgi:arylformamidase
MTVSHFRLGAHAGTHVDAPNHFLIGGGGIDSLPLDTLIGPAHVFAVPESAPTITAELLEHGGIPPDATRLLAKTRNSGWSSSDQAFVEDYVAFDESAAAWCLERGIRLLGIDYLSIEPFDADTRGFPVHTALLGAGVVIVESLELAEVEAGAYELIVAPLLVPGSDGAPARAVLIRV